MCAAVGNLFYLVMPSETGESTTDDDPPTPTADHFPECPLRQEVMSSSEDGTSLRLEEADGGVEVAACGGVAATDLDQSNALRLEEEEEDEEMGQSQTGSQSHVIKNVEQIFLTIEGLMSKLQHLKVRKRPECLCL